MTKRVGYLLAIAAAVAIAVGSGVAGEGDSHNCAVCKPMMEKPGLIEHVKWETHPIATGLIAVTTVDAGFEKDYAEAHTKMMAAVERMKSDEKMELCPICQGMGKLSKAGAKFENIESEGGAHILAVTSAEPSVVKQIHEHQKMTAEIMKSHAEGEGHGG